MPSDSCHLEEHKFAAVRYLTNRMETYNLDAKNKEKENNTIKQTLCNNKYDPSLINKCIPKRKKTILKRKDTSKTKWAKFTYIRTETKYITKLFSRIITSKSLTQHGSL